MLKTTYISNENFPYNFYISGLRYGRSLKLLSCANGFMQLIRLKRTLFIFFWKLIQMNLWSEYSNNYLMNQLENIKFSSLVLIWSLFYTKLSTKSFDPPSNLSGLSCVWAVCNKQVTFSNWMHYAFHFFSKFIPICFDLQFWWF